ncbi:MAG: hypothetical protein U9R79_19460 [Armatimonadota bacterium]|nr:hypothetical protein [Armatimonadota bacterium]
MAGAPDSSGSPARWRRAAVALGAAFVLGAAGLYTAGMLHAGPVLWPDACGYLSGAKVVAERQEYGLSLVQLNPFVLPDPPDLDRVPWWPPGYSVAIALASGLNPGDPSAMVAAAHVLDLVCELAAAAGFGLLAALAVRSSTAGFVAAGLYLLSAPCMFEAPRLESEHLYLALMAWAAVLHMRGASRPRGREIAGAAVLWALAALTRHVAVVAAGCAGLAAVAIAWPHADRWRRAAYGLLPTLACWAGAGAWVVRNLAIAGRPTAPLWPGLRGYAAQATEVALSYFWGISGTALMPSAAPQMRDLVMLAGGFLLGASLLTLAVAAVMGRRQHSPEAWRWLLVFAGCLVPVSILMLVYVSVNQRINTPFGRLISPATAVTVALLIAGAVRYGLLRAPVILLAICITAGGLLQGATNLLLPNGWEALADLRALAADEQVREAVRGKRLLLAAEDGVRPAVDLVPVSVFVPTARTVYWVDNPQYAGVVLSGEDIADLVRQGAFELLLRGPRRRVVEGAAAAGVGTVRRARERVREQYAQGQLNEIRYLQQFTVRPPLKTGTIATHGDWTVERVLLRRGPPRSNKRRRD